MEGSGEITVRITETERHALIDISDTGKGIPKSALRKYSIRVSLPNSRGWGLGCLWQKGLLRSTIMERFFVRHSK